MTTPPWNPYREWLGISGQASPPTWYELLDVSPDEQDAARIEAAYQQRYERVRLNQVGVYKSEAVRILHELTQAYLGLLDADLRRAYDQSLVVPTPHSPPVPPADRSKTDSVPPPPVVVVVGNRPEEVATQSIRETQPGDEAAEGRVTCGACEFRFGGAIVPPPLVRLTTDDDVVSEPLVVRTRSDWWRTHAEIEADESLWSGASRDTCLHRLGFALLALGGLIPVLAVASFFLGKDWSARIWWLGATTMMAAVAVTAAARWYVPPFASGVDWVWLRIIPIWLSERPRPERLAFLTALARLTAGRGDLRSRFPVARRALDSMRTWAAQAQATSAQLGWLARLAFMEWPRERTNAACLPTLLYELAAGHLWRNWTNEALDVALGDGKTLLWSPPEHRLLYQAALLTAALRTGLRVADVLRWSRESSSILAVFGDERQLRRMAGLWFAAQQHPLPKECQESMRTAWSAIRDGRVEDLRRWRQAWMVSTDGRIIVTAEGVHLDGMHVRDPNQVSWRRPTGKNASGAPFELVVGLRRIPCMESPANLVQQTVQMVVWWFDVVSSSAKLVAEPPRLPAERNWNQTIVRCPNCGSTLCARTGNEVEDEPRRGSAKNGATK